MVKSKMAREGNVYHVQGFNFSQEEYRFNPDKLLKLGTWGDLIYAKSPESAFGVFKEKYPNFLNEVEITKTDVKKTELSNKQHIYKSLGDYYVKNGKVVKKNKTTSNIFILE